MCMFSEWDEITKDVAVAIAILPADRTCHPFVATAPSPGAEVIDQRGGAEVINRERRRGPQSPTGEKMTYLYPIGE